MECSFYIEDHHPARLNELRVARSSSGLRVAFDAQFDTDDGYDEPAETGIPVSGELEVGFTGILLMKKSLNITSPDEITPLGPAVRIASRLPGLTPDANYGNSLFPLTFASLLLAQRIAALGFRSIVDPIREC